MRPSLGPGAIQRQVSVATRVGIFFFDIIGLFRATLPPGKGARNGHSPGALFFFPGFTPV